MTHTYGSQNSHILTKAILLDAVNAKTENFVQKPSKNALGQKISITILKCYYCDRFYFLKSCLKSWLKIPPH